MRGVGIWGKIVRRGKSLKVFGQAFPGGIGDENAQGLVVFENAVESTGLGCLVEKFGEPGLGFLNIGKPFIIDKLLDHVTIL